MKKILYFAMLWMSIMCISCNGRGNEPLPEVKPEPSFIVGTWEAQQLKKNTFIDGECTKQESFILKDFDVLTRNDILILSSFHSPLTFLENGMMEGRKPIYRYELNETDSILSLIVTDTIVHSLNHDYTYGFHKISDTEIELSSEFQSVLSDYRIESVALYQKIVEEPTIPAE